MNRQNVITLAVGLALGFAAGFIFADSADRKERDRLSAEVARLRSGDRGAGKQQADKSQSGDAELTDLTGAQLRDAIVNLTDEQLRAAVTKADADPANVQLQKMTGQVLYFYAYNKRDVSVLPEAVRILKRANEADPADYVVLRTLADSIYTVAFNSEPQLMGEAREYLEKAQKIKPDETDVIVQIGLTYHFDKPPDTRRAIREYRRALELDPRHEGALENLALALVAEGDLKGAEKTAAELEKVAPSSTKLADIRAQLAQKRNASGGPE